MALTKIKDWNPTDQGRVAQVVVWGVRGTDGEAYVMNVDPVSGGFPIDTVTSDLATESTLQAVESAVDGLEAEAALTNTKLDTVIGHVDGVETLTSAVITRLNEMPSGIVTVKHDSLYITYNATSDVLEYKQAGSTVATLTINYVDATKEVISSVVRT